MTNHLIPYVFSKIFYVLNIDNIYSFRLIEFSTTCNFTIIIYLQHTKLLPSKLKYLYERKFPMLLITTSDTRKMSTFSASSAVNSYTVLYFQI